MNLAMMIAVDDVKAGRYIKSLIARSMDPSAS
jgi:hypothetical protein